MPTALGKEKRGMKSRGIYVGGLTVLAAGEIEIILEVQESFKFIYPKKAKNKLNLLRLGVIFHGKGTDLKVIA